MLDQMIPGTGAMPSYNSGGAGEKFVIINVQGQYGLGIHFRIVVKGKREKSENEISSSEAKH